MSKFIFQSCKDFEQCHASTLVQLDDGRILAAWFGGSRESHPDTAIWASVLKNGRWSKPRCMANINLTAHWNPVLFKDLKKRIHLFFKTGNKITDWKTHIMTLDEPGKSWTYPRELVKNDRSGGRGPVRSKPIILSNGDWLAPASKEVKVWSTWPPKDIWHSFVDRSTDEGKTWTKSDPIEYDRQKYGKYGGVIQPCLWESKEGHVHMLLRSTVGCICRSDSEDYGHTWSPVEPTDLPNNNSGIDVTKTDEGILALVYNPVASNWGARTPLCLSFSEGEGRVWTKPAAFEAGEGSFSYPSIIPIDGGIALTYTWNRVGIAYREFFVKKTNETKGNIPVLSVSPKNKDSSPSKKMLERLDLRQRRRLQTMPLSDTGKVSEKKKATSLLSKIWPPKKKN